MFEELTARLRAKAEARAQVLARQLTDSAGEVLPKGITAAADADGVRLTGRGLRRRMATDPALRSLWQRLL